MHKSVEKENPLTQLINDGFVVIKNVLSDNEITKITEEIDTCIEHTPNCVEYIDPLIQKTLYRYRLPSLTAVCPKAVKIILKSQGIAVAESYFKEEPRVGEFELRKSLFPSYKNPLFGQGNYTDGNLLKMHVDPHASKALYFFTMLTEMSKENGPTFVFSQSNQFGYKPKEGFWPKQSDYIEAKSRGCKLVVLDNISPGDMIIFDLDTWHGRMPAKVGGRSVLMTKLYPASHQDECSNLLFSRATLDELNEKERRILVGETTERKRSEVWLYKLTGLNTTFKYVDRPFNQINKLFKRLGELRYSAVKHLSSNKVIDKEPAVEDLFN